MGTGDGDQASSVFIQAGKLTGLNTPGGSVLLQGGAGSSRETYYGGDGGNIQLVGGTSSGNHLLNDRAGNVLLEGGESTGNGIGGSIKLKSGRGSISSRSDFTAILHLQFNNQSHADCHFCPPQDC